MGPPRKVALLPGSAPDELSAEIIRSLREHLAACNCEAAAPQPSGPAPALTIVVLTQTAQLPQASELGGGPLLVVASREMAAQCGALGHLPLADFLLYPFEPAELCLRLERLTGQPENGVSDEVNLVKRKLRQRLGRVRTVGESPAFREAMERVAAAARYDAPVLVCGESGTGKELCARTLHYLSPRAGGPFLPVSCAAVPETLIENELFGHVKGAYTDASTSEQGLVQAAEGGTIFLDEIDGLAVGVQAKLLRFLQEKEYRPVGGARFLKANVRVVAATNADLPGLVRQGGFRQDLYHRLCVIPIELPPLRKRVGDIPLLARHFLRKYAARFNKEVTGLSRQAEHSLAQYAWPGNVRELENVIQRAVIFAATPLIEEVEIDAWPGSVYGPFQEEKEKLLRSFTRDYLRRVLKAAGGNVTQAARLAGKDRRAFWELMRRYDFDKAGLA